MSYSDSLFRSDQIKLVAQSCPTLCDPVDYSMPDSVSFTISQSWFKLMSIESVMPSYHLILCHPLLLLTSIFPSIRAFSNELVLPIRWPKYWNWGFSFIISPSNEHSWLISFRIDPGSPCCPGYNVYIGGEMYSLETY